LAGKFLVGQLRHSDVVKGSTTFVILPLIQGSAPDPAGGAHDAPPDPLVGWGGGHPSPRSQFPWTAGQSQLFVSRRHSPLRRPTSGLSRLSYPVCLQPVKNCPVCPVMF